MASTSRWVLLLGSLAACGGADGLWVAPELTLGAVEITPPTVEPTYAWLVSDLDLASASAGFDLDDDRLADNALAARAAAVDPRFATARTSSTTALMVELDRVADLSDDPEIGVGLLTVTDRDGDGVDDPSPSTLSETALVDGAYDAVLDQPALAIGDLALQAATPMYLSGEPGGELHSGIVGFGISLPSLLDTLATLGADPAELARITALADLDTDVDGQPDAVSAAFRFTAERSR